MCGRYGLTSDPDKIVKEFDAEKSQLEFRENYNVAPTQKMPVIERHSPNSLHLRYWGFKAHWNPKLFLINAKSEKLAESRVWSKAFRESRCIVPADYFFEWKKLSSTDKQPYLIRLKNKKMMGFAGLLISHIDDEGKDSMAYVIITTSPNKLMADIHDRMPVILDKEDQDEWLNPDNSEPEQLEKLLKPYSADEMEAYPVSKLVSKPQNNSPEIVKKINIYV